MILVLADAKNHDDTAMHLQFFQSNFAGEKKADLFLVANTGSEKVDTYRMETGFQQLFVVKSNGLLTVCTGTPKSDQEVLLTKENKRLHEQFKSAADENKKASVVIIRYEEVNSGFGPIKIANVKFGVEFPSVEAVSILVRVAPLLVDWNNGKAMIAFHIASPITKKCVEVLDMFLDKGHFGLIDDYQDARRNLHSGLLVTNDIKVNGYSQKSALYRDKDDGKMKTFVMEYYKIGLTTEPSSVLLPVLTPPTASSGKKNTEKRKQYQAPTLPAISTPSTSGVSSKRSSQKSLK